MQGGLNAPFMSIYVPAGYQKGGATEKAHSLIDIVEALAGESPDKFAIPHSMEDVLAHTAAGLISLPLGMENGAALEGSFPNLEVFHARGIRYITLTHSRNNDICDSSYDRSSQWGGLSPFGRELVPAMNRLGVMVDISHVSDETFFHVMELVPRPATFAAFRTASDAAGCVLVLDSRQVRLRPASFPAPPPTRPQHHQRHWTEH